MPRLITRMQAAFDRIKWGGTPSPRPTSSTSLPPPSSLTPPEMEALIRLGVADGIQQFLSSLHHTSHMKDDEEGVLSDTQSLTDEPVPIAPPSMVSLGDVSLQPRSTVACSQPLMKVWLVQNSGETPWPDHLRLLPKRDAASPFLLESDVLLFTDIPPQGQLKLSVPITTPSQGGRYVGEYQLAYEGAGGEWVSFGDPLIIDLTCKESGVGGATVNSSLSPASPVGGEGGEGGVSGGAEEKQGARKSSREQKEAAIIRKIVDSAVEPSPERPTSPPEGESKGEGVKKERLRVEKGKDRSASVDSKPPTLNTEWFSFVPSDAKARPLSGGAGTAPLPGGPTGAEANLLSSSPPSSADDQALDWLNDARGGDMKVAVVPSTPLSSAAPVGSTLRPLVAPLHASKSASHSRSNSPALPPQPFASTPSAFARSTSQVFAPQGGDLLSPPLTPTVPQGKSILSKDDLMSWAGGQGLSVTNKQTGIQHPSASPPPLIGLGGGGVGAAGGSTAQVARHLSSSPSARSRHSMPPNVPLSASGGGAGGGGSASGGGAGGGSGGGVGSTDGVELSCVVVQSSERRSAGSRPFVGLHVLGVARWTEHSGGSVQAQSRSGAELSRAGSLDATMREGEEEGDELEGLEGWRG